MLKWVPYPFLRLCPVFICGILLAQVATSRLPVALLCIVAFLYAFIAFALPKRLRFQWSSIVGMLGLLWLLFTSVYYTQYRQETIHPYHLSQLEESYSYYEAVVLEPATPKTNSYKSLLKVRHVVVEDSSGLNVKPAKATIIVYQPKTDSLKLLNYGDIILVKARPQKVKAPANPHEFDYRQFLSYQQVYHQQYLKGDDWVLKEKTSGNVVMAFAYQLRENCRKIFEDGIQDRQARSIALALVLGIKSELDHEIRSAYAAAGAMHVLAVSGLHVGIIYMVLLFFLKPIKKSGKWGRVLTAVLSLLLLWAYALLTGLSPSVMRAATMFSFIVIADTSRRQTNIYNTIAASAFFLLLYNPFLLMSVGFQLSYLAVLGIVYLQPKISNWVTVESRFLNWCWELTAVSLAAQIVTFPLGLLYFQQFPVYFWLSNLLVIPAAYAILSLALCCFTISAILPSVVVYFSALLEHVILSVNYGVKLIEKFPYSVIQNVYFSRWEAILLYLGIVFLLLLLHYRQFKYMLCLCTVFLLMFSLRWLHIYQEYNTQSITFYHVKKDTHIDFTTKRTNIHLGETNEKLAYHIIPNQIYKGVKNTLSGEKLASQSMALKDWRSFRFLVWNGQKIAMITQPLDAQYLLSESLSVDILLVCNNAISSLSELGELLSYKQLVIDSSNTYYHALKLSQEAEELKLNYHCVPLQGAYEYQLN